MSYFIYKYVINDEIIYIGQSVNLRNRIAQHKQDKLKNIANKAKIYYFECLNKTAMISWEYNLINKYHPKYNAALNNKEENIHIEEPNWILYNENNFPIIIKKKEEKTKRSKSFNIDIDFLLNNNQNNIIKKSNIIYHFYDCSCFEQKLMIYLLIKSKLLNIDLNKVTGNTIEYVHFCGMVDSGNTYKRIKETSDSFIKKIENNTFQLTEKGINYLINFEELDIDYLINILKYINSKYTCFILDALLQTEDYILYLNELTNYLGDSYTKFDHIRKRVLEPAVKEGKLIGFNLSCIPQKNGRKYTSICFKQN